MIKIAYKNKTKLIDEILKNKDVQELEKKGFFSKLKSKNKEYAHIYFHSGEIDKEANSNIINAKKVICNSISSKNTILKQTNISEDKVEIIYPSITFPSLDEETAKKSFYDKFNINYETKLLLFHAKNLKSAGVKEFLNVFLNLSYKNKKAVICGDEVQINNLKTGLRKHNLDEEILLLSDHKNTDELYLASDVFLLPSHNKTFASSILKAMSCKTAVFITSNNQATEIVDVFSTMEHPSDPSTTFKVDALLARDEDLELIKNENEAKAKHYTLEKSISKINEIISSI